MAERRNISQSERLALKKAWKNVCAYCEKPVNKFEIDHIVAHAHGGTCDLDNLCVTCLSCNRRKLATPLPKMYEGLLLSLASRKARQVKKLLANAPKKSRKIRNKHDRCEHYYKPAARLLKDVDWVQARLDWNSGGVMICPKFKWYNPNTRQMEE